MYMFTLCFGGLVLGVGKDGGLGWGDTGGLVLKGYFLGGSCVRGAEMWVGVGYMIVYAYLVFWGGGFLGEKMVGGEWS